MLYYQLKNQSAKKTPILTLHGFTGTHNAFSFFEDALFDHPLIMLDLPGHGHSTNIAASEFSMSRTIDLIREILDHEGYNQVIVCGYSMGGRIAIGFASIFPEYVAGLILISTSPGLKTEAERVARRLSDNKLAQKIETEGVLSFVDYWETLPLFASQKALSAFQKAEIRTERLSQHAYGLETSLREIGTGKQPSYWPNLDTFHFPVLILTGKYDEKFSHIAKEMKERLPHAHHHEIEQSGHTVQIERQQETTKVIKNWLETAFLGGSYHDI